MRFRELIVENIKIDNRLINTIIKQVPYTEEIYLYGSRARGTHKPTSDFDILVIVPDSIVGSDFLDLQTLLDSISSQFSTYNQKYDIQGSHTWNMLYKVAKEEGIQLYKNNTK